jgi:hypothetical protein
VTKVEEMERISSRATGWNKKSLVFFGLLLSGMTILFVAAVPIIAFHQHENVPPLKFAFLLLMPVAPGTLSYWMWQTWSRMVDEVWDAGERLVVRRRRQEDSVALSNIAEVLFSRGKPELITLRLVTPGLFGDRIVFQPRSNGLDAMFSRNKVFKDLKARVDRLQRS